MSSRVLPHDVVSLVHHVELAAAGWRERLSEQLLLVSLASQRGPRAVDDLIRELSNQLSVTLTPSAFVAATERLIGRGLAVRAAGGGIALSMAGRDDVDRRRAESSELESRVVAAFSRIASQTCPQSSPVELWEHFVETCLIPLVTELGARTYQFVSGDPIDGGSIQSMSSFVSRFSDDEQAGIQALMAQFFESSNRDVREYVLQHLNAHFLSLAGGLSETALAAISNRLRRSLQLGLFLDTNFLFSVLDLHDNPANDAATELVAMLKRVRGKVDCKLYVYPLTVDEAQRALAYHEGALAAAYMTPKLGNVAIASGAPVSGLVMRYLRAVAESKGRISAHDFLAPYLTDMLPVLRAKGVELYNANIEGLTTSQPVIDDIIDQQAFEAEHFPDRQKPYEALRHDVALWHLVKGRRGSSITSPLDAAYWIVTIDFRLLGFDAHKQRELGSAIPVCVHPAVLLQMLQLWLPRDEEFDRALFDGVRALLPQVFDAEAENTTIKILGALSRYENVDDLPTDTVAHVLMNDALRGRLRTEREIGKQVELVKDAIVSQVKEARAKVAEAEAQRAVVELELRRQREATDQGSQKARERYESVQREKAEVEERLSAERANREALQERINTLEHSIEALDARAIADLNRRRAARELTAFITVGIGTLAAAMVSSIYIPAVVVARLGLSSVTATAMSWTGSFSVGGTIVWFSGRMLPTVRKWKWFARLVGLFRFVLGGAWLVFLGLVSIYLWEHRQ